MALLGVNCFHCWVSLKETTWCGRLSHQKTNRDAEKRQSEKVEKMLLSWWLPCFSILNSKSWHSPSVEIWLLNSFAYFKSQLIFIHPHVSKSLFLLSLCRGSIVHLFCLESNMASAFWWVSLNELASLIICPFGFNLMVQFEFAEMLSSVWSI